MSWSMKTTSTSKQQQHWKLSVLDKGNKTFLHIDEMQMHWYQQFLAPSTKLLIGL
jgi:hypothetical protein